MSSAWNARNHSGRPGGRKSTSRWPKYWNTWASTSTRRKLATHRTAPMPAPPARNRGVADDQDRRPGQEPLDDDADQRRQHLGLGRGGALGSEGEEKQAQHAGGEGQQQ